MNRLLLPLAAIAIAAALSAPLQPAHACSCAFPSTEEQVREAMGYYDAAVLASIAEPASGGPKLKVDVETAYMGPDLGRITIEQPADVVPDSGSGGLAHLGADCSFALLGEPGERYVLFLTSTGADAYRAGGCSSFPLAWAETSEPFQAFYDALQRLESAESDPAPPPAATPEDDARPEPWQAPSRSGDDTPWLPIVAGAALSGAALLAAGGWLLRRRGII
jgi:hypothetical protein